MFTDLLDTAMGVTDAELDEQIRASELALRELQGRRAMLLAVAEHRGVYRVDGHRSMKGYLRATFNASDGEALRERTVATVCAVVPGIGDALLAGRIGVSQVLEIARIHRNPRTRKFFERVAPIYVERAEVESLEDLRCAIDDFLNLADQDGAFAELYSDVEGRSASVNVIDGKLDMRVSGGDPITAEEVRLTFEWFCEREFERDVRDRADRFGEAAIEHPLGRSDRQRRFDAVVAMARAARAYGDGAKPADVVVNLVADPVTMVEAFAEAGLVVDTPDGVETIVLSDTDVDDVLAVAADDPARFTTRRCHTSRGTAIHPRSLLRAALTGYVRRVVIDSQGVVVDWGRRKRFFQGDAREAAKLLVRRCTHPGCAVCPEHADVDHAEEWFRDLGTTDQWNANVECATHNRFKSRARWRVRRDTDGRRFYVRPDGTVVLPVGVRQPDFTDDEMNRIIRARLAELRPAS
jgi:hypothetical protein